MARILIIRFSALGDVAMTIPVVHSLAVQYPQLEITVLSRAVWQPLFQGLPANVSFIGADLTGKHKGLWGLNTLYSELKAKSFDYVADFHHVLRTKYLCLRFRLANIPVASIYKGRVGKEKLVRRRHKVLENQKSSFRRYADVLEKLGFPVLLTHHGADGDSSPQVSRRLAHIAWGDADRGHPVGHRVVAKRPDLLPDGFLLQQGVVHPPEDLFSFHTDSPSRFSPPKKTGGSPADTIITFFYPLDRGAGKGFLAGPGPQPCSEGMDHLRLPVFFPVQGLSAPVAVVHIFPLKGGAAAGTDRVNVPVLQLENFRNRHRGSETNGVFQVRVRVRSHSGPPLRRPRAAFRRISGALPGGRGRIYQLRRTFPPSAPRRRRGSLFSGAAGCKGRLLSGSNRAFSW